MTQPLSKAWCSIQLYYFIDLTGLAVAVLHSRHFILNVRLLMSKLPGKLDHLHESIEPCNHLKPWTPHHLAWLCSLWDAWWDGQTASWPEAWPQHYILLTDVLPYNKTPPVITLSYSRSICMTYRGAVTSCKLDVALDYISTECFLPLRLAITIITFLARQDRSAVAHKVKMSRGF